MQSNQVCEESEYRKLEAGSAPRCRFAPTPAAKLPPNAFRRKSRHQDATRVRAGGIRLLGGNATRLLGVHVLRVCFPALVDHSCDRRSNPGESIRVAARPETFGLSIPTTRQLNDCGTTAGHHE